MKQQIVKVRNLDGLNMLEAIHLHYYVLVDDCHIIVIDKKNNDNCLYISKTLDTSRINGVLGSLGFPRFEIVEDTELDLMLDKFRAELKSLNTLRDMVIEMLKNSTSL